MTPAEQVTTTLEDLCRRAGVSPADGSDEAGNRVWDVLEREVRWEAQGPAHCPLNAWLRAATRLERALVTESHVVLPGDITQFTARKSDCGRACELVPLPPALVAAVRIYDRKLRRVGRAAA